jgi:DNA topoisomerase-1
MPGRTDFLQEEYLRREGKDPKKFKYFWPDGTPYQDEDGISRIASLAVPPAYTDVFVSPDADAELQAFGRDAAGRLQYRYHPDFVQAGALKKWQRLTRFATALPTLREVTTGDLRLSGLPPRKVMALMTRLLHVAHFRVGSDAYARRHKTYGLSTLRQRHVTAKDFRTWGGTLLAAEYLAEAGVTETERAARKVLVDCVKHVADDLGNTPAVTRGSYICPVIFDRYLEGKVLDDYEPRAGRLPAELEGLSRSEAALKRLLESEKALKQGRGRRAA